MSTTKLTPARTLLKKECRKRGLPVVGNSKTLLMRLTEDETQQKDLTRHTVAQKTLASTPDPDMLKTKTKKKKAETKEDEQPKFTTQANPFPHNYTATQFVSEKYGPNLRGDDIMVPEWKVHRHSTKKMDVTELVIPRTRNTKGGLRLRWVLYNKKNI